MKATVTIETADDLTLAQVLELYRYLRATLAHGTRIALDVAKPPTG